MVKIGMFVLTKTHTFLPLSTKVLTVSFGVAFGPTLLPLSTLGTKWEIFLEGTHPWVLTLTGHGVRYR